jgi:ADP-ribose pyrophosphatase
MRPARVVRRHVIYEGRVVRVVREVLRTGRGRMTRDVIRHPGAVVVLPVLAGGRIVLVRQYRHAVGCSLLELPAGTLDRGESPLVCARRELEEETGWRARRWRRLSQFYGAPGVLSELMHLFLARDLVPGQAQPDPDEELQTVILTLRQALAQVRSGVIQDAKTIIGILLAERIL